MQNKGIGGHHRAFAGLKDEWLTPLNIITALGPFDLDPCAPIVRPWPTAAAHYTLDDDGLSKPWDGNVWLNPPYGPKTKLWMERLAQHGNGIALIFGRTETDCFFKAVWGRADAMLFIRGRIHFCDVSGMRAKNNSGAPSVLIAYGRENANRLLCSKISGFLVDISGGILQ